MRGIALKCKSFASVPPTPSPPQPWKEISQEHLVENESLNADLGGYKRIVNKNDINSQKR